MLSVKRCIVALFIFIIAGIACFAYAYFIEPYRIEVNTVDVSTDKLQGTHLRIAHISDLHCDIKVRNEDELVRIINPLKPDIIVFTGDALNTRTALPIFKKALKRLDANIGKYAVTGNIDEWYWSSVDFFGGTGFRHLEDESHRLSKDKEEFYISGINFVSKDRYFKILKGIPDNKYSILLYHTPDLVQDLGGVNVDLYLAGHTHGGQACLPFYGALITLSEYGKKYESGKFTVGGTTLYVNRGLGMEGGIVPRIRFFCRPEITVININPEVSKKKETDK